jgi:4-hydroxybenzoate polyprenyltransferase
MKRLIESYKRLSRANKELFWITVAYAVFWLTAVSVTVVVVVLVIKALLKFLSL